MGRHIIVGCGRVGSTVARALAAAGNDVAVIDRKSSAFRRLGADFTGRTLTGVGFDRDLLVAAGISPDCSVAAVTNGDNSNILVARVAREMFGVQRVVARIYDPRRAELYERMGIRTVATVAWASSRVLQLMSDGVADVAWIDPTSRYVLVEREVPGSAAGRRLDEVGARVVLLTRIGSALVPDAGTLLQEGDLVHLLDTPAAIEKFDEDVVGGSHEETEHR